MVIPRLAFGAFVDRKRRHADAGGGLRGSRRQAIVEQRNCASDQVTLDHTCRTDTFVARASAANDCHTLAGKWFLTVSKPAACRDSQKTLGF